MGHLPKQNISIRSFCVKEKKNENLESDLKGTTWLHDISASFCLMAGC